MFCKLEAVPCIFNSSRLWSMLGLVSTLGFCIGVPRHTNLESGFLYQGTIGEWYQFVQEWFNLPFCFFFSSSLQVGDKVRIWRIAKYDHSLSCTCECERESILMI